MLNPLDLFVAGEIVNRALDEDVGRGDITSRSTVRSRLNARGSFIAKQDLVLAGLEIADLVFGWFDEYIQIESTVAGGDAEAVRRARETAGHLHKIEVEVATLEQVKEALDSRADILLLDNMTPETVAQAVRITREREGDDRRTLLEASGGINLSNVRQYAEAGVDLISIGALTHSAPSVDISFKIRPA